MVDKGAEVGAHILSGNVFEVKAMDELLPNWKDMDSPIKTPALEDKFLFLTQTMSVTVPHFLLPKTLHQTAFEPFHNLREFACNSHHLGLRRV